MTGKFIGSGLAALVLTLAGSAALAQATSQATAAPAAKTSATQESLNLDNDIKLLRKNVRQEKSKLMLQALQLDSDQTAKFLPIYKEYTGKLTALNDLREANIREYAANYSTMTDNKADELVNQAISYYKKRAGLLDTYYGKVRGALGSGVAARFAQTETLLNNVVDLQIQSNLPLIKAK